MQTEVGNRKLSENEKSILLKTGSVVDRELDEYLDQVEAHLKERGMEFDVEAQKAAQDKFFEHLKEQGRTYDLDAYSYFNDDVESNVMRDKSTDLLPEGHRTLILNTLSNPADQVDAINKTYGNVVAKLDAEGNTIVRGVNDKNWDYLDRSSVFSKTEPFLNDLVEAGRDVKDIFPDIAELGTGIAGQSIGSGLGAAAGLATFPPIAPALAVAGGMAGGGLAGYLGEKGRDLLARNAGFDRPQDIDETGYDNDAKRAAVIGSFGALAPGGQMTTKLGKEALTSIPSKSKGIKYVFDNAGNIVKTEIKENITPEKAEKTLSPIKEFFSGLGDTARAAWSGLPKEDISYLRRRSRDFAKDEKTYKYDKAAYGKKFEDIRDTATERMKTVEGKIGSKLNEESKNLPGMTGKDLYGEIKKRSDPRLDKIDSRKGASSIRSAREEAFSGKMFGRRAEDLFQRDEKAKEYAEKYILEKVGKNGQDKVTKELKKEASDFGKEKVALEAQKNVKSFVKESKVKESDFWKTKEGMKAEAYKDIAETIPVKFRKPDAEIKGEDFAEVVKNIKDKTFEDSRLGSKKALKGEQRTQAEKVYLDVKKEVDNDILEKGLTDTYKNTRKSYAEASDVKRSLLKNNVLKDVMENMSEAPNEKKSSALSSMLSVTKSKKLKEGLDFIDDVAGADKKLYDDIDYLKNYTQFTGHNKPDWVLPALGKKEAPATYGTLKRALAGTPSGQYKLQRMLDTGEIMSRDLAKVGNYYGRKTLEEYLRERGQNGEE